MKIGFALKNKKSDLVNRTCQVRLKSFTLLEILVVIGIIGVLVGLGTTSYSTAQKKARDAKRKADLKAVQNCLEQYYSYNNTFQYPTLTVVGGTLTTPDPLNCGGTSTMPLPTDPGSNNYSVSASSTSAYTITTTMESTGVGGSATYSVSNLQ